jgi:tetratricopeptide (TPR) repeat protein
MTKDKQSALYDKGMKLFSSGDFAKAKGILEQVAAGPSAEIAHAARMHKAACERRLEAVKVRITSPEEHYNYAIALINRRELSGARDHLKKALDKLPGGDHLHYALALCNGLDNELEEAGEHLRQAIQIDPRNRSAARNDPDFEPFISAPEISAVLQQEGTGSE